MRVTNDLRYRHSMLDVAAASSAYATRDRSPSSVYSRNDHLGNRVEGRAWVAPSLPATNVNIVDSRPRIYTSPEIQLWIYEKRLADTVGVEALWWRVLVS